MFYKTKNSAFHTVLFCVLIGSVSIAEQIRKPLFVGINDEKNTVCNVAIQEEWRESAWINFAKSTVCYSFKSNYLKEEIQKWNGNEWLNESCKISCYDKLQFENAKVLYRWNKIGYWEMVEGERSYVDTIMNNGYRLILYNCLWEPKKKIWIAEDSIFYDLKGQISKQVSRDSVYSEESKKKTGVVVTSEFLYLNENTWIEVQTTNYPEEKNVEKEQYRYRKINNFSIPAYIIDAWDEEVNGWILNTAKLFRKQNNSRCVYDSIEEIINGQATPVYISEEQRDISGNLMLRRIKIREYDEDKNEWNGNYYKWERSRCMSDKEYYAAESSFTLDSSGKSWQLNNYEKKVCRHPLNGKYEESAYYDKNLKELEFVQTFDTLLSSGILINKENFFDSEKKQWVPLTDFTYTQSEDTISIIKTSFDIDKNKWDNDSLIFIQVDSLGVIVSRINQVWTQDGLFTGKWKNASRINYKK
jgi:hypothetical protein